MKRIYLLVPALAVMLLSCSKSDDANPNGNAGLTFEKNLDVSGLACGLGYNVSITPDYAFFRDSCQRVIRFDSELNALDWIGYDAQGVFGYHSLLDMATATDGYIDLYFGNNTHLYFIKMSATWMNKKSLKFDIASGSVDTLNFSIYDGEFFMVLNNGKFIQYDYQAVKMNRYNADGSFDIAYNRPEALSFADSYTKGDQASNLWVLDNIQNAGAGPHLNQYGNDGELIATYKTAFSESYLPGMALSDDDLIYLESFDFALNQSVVMAYNTDGKRVKTYYGPKDKRIIPAAVFHGKLLYYNDKAQTPHYEIYGFKP